MTLVTSALIVWRGVLSNKQMIAGAEANRAGRDPGKGVLKASTYTAIVSEALLCLVCAGTGHPGFLILR